MPLPLKSTTLLSSLAALSLSTLAAQADVPQVVTDIQPIHGLVARVMQGVGEPTVLLRKGGSPHELALRPSDAAALQAADLVVFTGGALLPWLEETLDDVAPQAHHMALENVTGTLHLNFRESVIFGEDGAEDAHADHDDHDDHEKHDDHEDHDDHEKHDDHDDHAHDDDGLDPHMWLSPKNAAVWLGAIAEELSELDPENAATYAANAVAGVAEIDAAAAELATKLDALHTPRFIVFHDAYQYFENHFGIEAIGTVAISDASAPVPKRISLLQEELAHEKIDCAFAEPQYSPKMLETVLGGTEVAIGMIDPLGADLDEGADFYVALLASFGAAFEVCDSH